MSYRDVSESLRGYRDRVAGDLEAARSAARDAAERAGKVKMLEKELAETEELLSKLGGPRVLPLLDDVAIAAPCSASWEEMVGDDRMRFCRHCEKNVYNLSSLPRDEAEALLAAREGKMCVRLYKRSDGTVLTSDCPVGARRRRRRRAMAGVLGGGLLAAGAALTTTSARTTQGAIAETPAMGSAVTIMGTPPAMGEPAVTADPSPGPVTGGIMPPTTHRPVQGRPMQGKIALPPQRTMGVPAPVKTP